MNEMTGPANTSFEFRRLNRLLEAATLLNSTLDLKEVTEIILQIVRDQVPVERVTAFRVDRKRRLLHSLVAQEAPQEITLPVGSGIAGAVAETGEVLDIPDAYADPRFNSNFDRILNYRTRDILALPVVNRQDEIVGVIELLNRTRPISSSDLEFLQGISIYIGLALQNASLYREAMEGEHDDKELVRLRDQLATSDRRASIAQALFGILHYINNPLAIAMGYAGLLQVQFALDNRTLEHAQKIESAVQRAADVAKRFAFLAEGEAAVHEAVDAGKLLREVIELRIPEWEILGIGRTIHVHSASVLGDPKQLQVIFMHLLVNAEEACAPDKARGHIRVQLSSDALDQQVRIEVEDNGPGIPVEIQNHVFEPFSTNRIAGRGVGLGLAMVREVVQRHKGQVSFETTLGKGTTFVIELPTLVRNPALTTNQVVKPPEI